MRDAKGRLIKASAAFRVMRDQLQTSDRALERRRIGFERMFQTLAKVGLKRKDLYQAWDFTVASTPNATERAVDIRDNAFAVLGDNNLVDRAVKGGAPRYALDAAAGVRAVRRRRLPGRGRTTCSPAPSPAS